jgi:UDP:flavonoid glycosyltransferase YjiC (YdhE family)
VKVLLSCQPAVGHFHPMVPLARALAAAGHEPTFVTSASFCRYIERAGLPAVAAGIDWTASNMEQAFPDIGNPTNMDDIARALPRVFGQAAGALVPDLQRLLTSTGADLLVSEGTEWGGPLAAESVGVPHVLLGATAFHPLPVYAKQLGAYWQYGRRGLGLPEDPDLHRLSPYLYLDGYPPSMQPQPITKMVRPARLIRPVIYQLGDPTPPPWLDDLQDRPTVYVSMGTVFNRVERAFDAILRALAGAPYNVVVLVGANRDPASLGEWPDNIRIVSYVPEAALLPRADLVISHGGYNTMVAALSHGRPMLCLPIGGDQPYTAFRVQSCGAGLQRALSTATSTTIRLAVEELLVNDLYRLNAQRLQREIAAMPAPADAIVHLERIAAAGVDRPGAALPSAAG